MLPYDQQDSPDFIVSGEWAILSPETVISDFALLVEDGQIVKTGSRTELEESFPTVPRYGGDNCIMMPGLMNTHTHLFQTFVKGVGGALDLSSWVSRVTSPVALNLTREDAYLSAMVGLMEAVRSGTTFIAEFSYAFPDRETFEGILCAFEEIGLRGWLGLGINDTGVENGVNPRLIYPIPEQLKLADSLQSKIRSSTTDRLSFTLNPTSIRSISTEGLRATVEYVLDHDMHWSMHVNETSRDNAIAMQRSGKPLLRYMADLGVLNERLLAVHCVQTSEEDIRLMANYGVSVSYNPISNLYLGSGFAPVTAMHKAKVNVALGTDGAGSNNSQDMLESLKMAVLCQRGAERLAKAMEAKDGLQMATINGAQAVGLGEMAGTLQEGRLADIIVLRADTPKMIPVYDPLQSVLFSNGEENVDTVIVGGKVILENRHFVTIDEQRILAKANEAAINILKRSQIS
jgi:5-methylthioadenosine/S-adenosylhomocysteine deaminase